MLLVDLHAQAGENGVKAARQRKSKMKKLDKLGVMAQDGMQSKASDDGDAEDTNEKPGDTEKSMQDTRKDLDDASKTENDGEDAQKGDTGGESEKPCEIDKVPEAEKSNADKEIGSRDKQSPDRGDSSLRGESSAASTPNDQSTAPMEKADVVDTRTPKSEKKKRRSKRDKLMPTENNANHPQCDRN